VGEGNKIQGDHIDAIPETRRGRTIVKDMAEMGIAPGAKNLCPSHPVAYVFTEKDILLGDGSPEARPSGVGVELFIGAEEGGVATDATVKPRIGPTVSRD
jgi:hypothetical protein